MTVASGSFENCLKRCVKCGGTCTWREFQIQVANQKRMWSTPHVRYYCPVRVSVIAVNYRSDVIQWLYQTKKPKKIDCGRYFVILIMVTTQLSTQRL